jgi:hypothetical protein
MVKISKMVDHPDEFIYNYLCYYSQGLIMEIKAFKLITGEDILGEVESESETEFVLENPVGIAVVRDPKTGQPNIGFAPFPLHAEQKTGATIAISKKNVVYSYKPAEDFITNYDSIFGSGIIVPPQKQIITG